MNRVHMVSIAALVAAVGAAGTLAFQPETTRPTQPGQPSTQPGSQPGTQPGTQPGRGTQPGMQPGTQPGRDAQPGRTQPGRDITAQPGAGGQQFQVPMEGQKFTREQIDKLTQSWNADSKKAVQATLDKYGPPDGATFNMVVWHDAGPWKKVAVTNEPEQHNFPVPHKDVLIGYIPMKVPADKVDDLLAFDGSLIVSRTGGWIAAVCDKEENNIAALNLAHDIVQGSKTPQEAREQMAKIAMAGQQGTMDPLTQDFKFEVADDNQGDPDQPQSGGATTPGQRPGMDRPGTTQPGTQPGMDRPGTTPRTPGTQPTTPPRDPNNPMNPTDPNSPPRRPGGGG